jgi:hypothetical protein
MDNVQKVYTPLTPLFYKCCASKNWTSQRAANACTGDNDVDCVEITDPLVQDNVPSADTLLCMCAVDGNKLLAFENAIKATPELCTLGESALIYSVGLTLPKEANSQVRLELGLLRFKVPSI